MEANLRRYRGYQFCRNLWFWFPVFFLYFTSLVGLQRALLLEAIYYVSVVLLEVPSGYASDRFGRRIVLSLSAGFAAIAYASFLAASDFVLLAAGQVFLAASIAANSGSDASLLYDSLAALGRESDYTREEGLAASGGFLATSGAALVAGLAAGFSLRLPYALSLAGAVAMLWYALRFVEPPATRTEEPFLRQLWTTAALARRPVLGWCLAFVVATIVLEHVPYEFYQGYLDLLLESGARGYDLTLPLSGALVAASMLLASGASRLAASAESSWGPGRAMLFATAVQVVVIGAMGLVLHPLVVGLVLLRDIPSALAGPIYGRAVNDRVESSQRATFLSILSLAGRLAFGISLALGAVLVGREGEVDWPSLRAILLGYASFGLAALAALALARPRDLGAHGR